MLLALSLLVASTLAFSPYVDTPYEEIVSQRYTLSSATPIYNWGQLPFGEVTQVVMGSLSAGTLGSFVLSPTSAIFIQTNAAFTVYSVSLNGINLVAGSRLAVEQGTGLLTAVVTPTNAYEVACSVSANALECSIVNSVASAFGSINGVVAVTVGGTSLEVFIASMSGGYLYQPGKALTLLQSEPPTAVAYFAPKNLAAFGSNSSLMTYVNATLIRRDWATDIVNGAGGVYDAPITSLAFDSFGWLFVGTAACVDILFPNGTVNHLSRFQGLPYNQTTSVSIEYNTRL